MLKRLLVVGGSGALGRGVAARFKAAKWSVINVDFVTNDNDDLLNVTLDASKSTLQQLPKVVEGLKNKKVDAVVCAAGGWAGGNVASQDAVHNLAQMYTMNMESALLAAHVAATSLNPHGLLVLTGSAAALTATPEMVTYGMSKAATHHLVASAVPTLPPGATSLAILPITIDTPTNRKFMADADFSTWTPVDEIAQQLLSWSMDPSTRPASGHLVQVTTSRGQSTWTPKGNPFA
ncbi:hypothetical protein H310_12753 [Aphanomyces invadans]|uniref:Dihydropteridine reductase n=1 Tax=Aphanomyces invadans TaxID=157072 RepID=A0A024TGK7_9STRA|nr:hypothetical protein H310_12753 [Aphanomyces invadans]ETV93144.1 hypothetical protein H310_12753 [Aphanomyces invadans]|eukprot:XP_008878166.1 hypothetical protein H310_12753 [Aphanomyces invadans]